MKKQKKCYIYTRVSTAIQVDGYSLDAQKDKLRKYAEYQDMTIVSEFSDEGFSGKNIKDRPEFTRMMEKIESGEDGVDFVLVTDAHYNKKISDLQRRYDEQYDRAETIETQMDEWNSRLLSVRQEKISADNIYQLLLVFDKLYNTFTEVERSFIERIDIYPEKPDNGCWIRNIVFNFPMPVQGQEIKNLPLEFESTVETVCLLCNHAEKATKWANVTLTMEEYRSIKAKSEAQKVAKETDARKASSK